LEETRFRNLIETPWPKTDIFLPTQPEVLESDPIETYSREQTEEGHEHLEQMLEAMVVGTQREAPSGK
jgi:hypothetical protein